MVVLVLDEAGEGVEFGDEFAQNTQFVHLGEGGVDLTDLLQDGKETADGAGVAQEFGGNKVQAVADKEGKLKIERGVELLGQAKDAQEAGGVCLEDLGVFLGEGVAGENKALNVLLTDLAAGGDEGLEGEAGERCVFAGDGKAAFEQTR